MKACGKMADDVANVNIIKCVALFYKLGVGPKDFIHKEKFLIKLPRSLHKLLLGSSITSFQHITTEF